MRRNLIIALALIAALVAFAMPKLYDIQKLAGKSTREILIVYNADELRRAPEVLKAYQSVLGKEKFANDAVEVYKLLNIDPAAIATRVPVIILPDLILQKAPDHLGEWTRSYLDNGGNIAIIHDAGTKHPQGTFLTEGIFADIIGINNITHKKEGEKALTYGQIEFLSPKHQAVFDFPPEKLIGGKTFSAGNDKPQDMAVHRNEVLKEIPLSAIYAYVIQEGETEKQPAIVLTTYGKGQVLYVNMPLGQFTAAGDNFLAHSLFHTFLVKILNVKTD